MPAPQSPRVRLYPMGVLWRTIRLAVLIAVGGCDISTAPHASLAPPVKEGFQAQENTDVAEKFDQPVAPTRQPDPPHEPLLPADPFPRKVPVSAAALEGGVDWLNTAGPITLQSLRGKIVVLDFWTYCCINCMHILPDLKKLEEKYPNELVVIGIHSAKFETERESQNIREAILRYEIKHPVVNDANMIIWRHFDVLSWPTLWLIDPEGHAVGRISGEAVFEPLDQAIAALVKFHRAKGTLNENPVYFSLESSRTAETPLRFPGKVLADAAGDRLFIADSNHNRIVVTKATGQVLDVIGTGEIGRTDGAFDRATFFRPQGMALDGEVLYVADTENHLIRRADLKARTVSTVAGVGEQGQSRFHRPMPAKATALNSPWDLWMHGGQLYIAMAGPHQIWIWNPESDEVRAYAGSGREDIEDGDLLMSAFAQPSGLTSDGEWLYVADSEGSSVRAVPLVRGKEVWTVVGTADLDSGRLFEFGDVDGRNGQARLQHPLGVAWHDGTIYVADTYNNKIKAIDPENRTSRTFLGTGEPGQGDDPAQFNEPGGLSVAEGKIYVADTNNHTIRIIDLKTKQVRTLELTGLAPPHPVQAQRLPVFPNAARLALEEKAVRAGAVIECRVRVELAEGYELNSQAPMVCLVELVDSDALFDGANIGKPQHVQPPTTEFVLALGKAGGNGSGKVRVSLTYYLCREEAHGLCEVRSAVWDVPFRLSTESSQVQIDLVAKPRLTPTRSNSGSRLERLDPPRESD